MGTLWQRLHTLHRFATVRRCVAYTDWCDSANRNEPKFAMLKAILFDMDDTLLDWSQRAEDWHEHERRHLERVLVYIAQHVHPVSAPEAFHAAVRHFLRQAWLEAERGLRAPHLGNVIRDALEDIGVPRERINIHACLDAYNWQGVSGVVPFPDAGEVLPVLAARGLQIGLITNTAAPMWMRDRELDAYGLLPYFTDCRVAAADVGYIKPHPAIFEVALQRLGVAADEAIFVGDNPEADVAGAQNVGMRAVLRIAKGSPPPVSNQIVPDATITSLHELLLVLDSWYPGWNIAQ